MTKPKNPIRYGATVYYLHRTRYGEPWEIRERVVTSRRAWVSKWSGKKCVETKKVGDTAPWSGTSHPIETLFASRAAALRAVAEKDRALARKLLACADAADAEAMSIEAGNSEGHGG